MSQVTVISGAERRRPWTDDQKRALMAAAFAPGAKVSQVAAQADIRPSQIYRWRRDLAVSDSQLVPVVVTGRAEVPARGAALLIELRDATVHVMADAPAALVTATMRALRR